MVDLIGLDYPPVILLIIDELPSVAGNKALWQSMIGDLFLNSGISLNNCAEIFKILSFISGERNLTPCSLIIGDNRVLEQRKEIVGQKGNPLWISCIEKWPRMRCLGLQIISVRTCS